MAGYLELQLTAGTPEHIEEMCMGCFTSSLWRVEFYTITPDGVTPAATWTGCTECPGLGELKP